MLEIYKSAIGNQFEAVYCTLDQLIDQCPDPLWHAPVFELKFCQALFHALFFSDVYLGKDLASLRQQPFHREQTDFFGDYEELEDRPPQRMYQKSDLKVYLQHCRHKAKQVIAGETESTLAETPGFDWLDFPRAEVHVNNLRHLIHHAGQLSLRLRIDTGTGVDWVRTGWAN